MTKQEQHLETSLPTVFLKERSHAPEVGLRVKCPADTAVCAIRGATKFGTLAFKIVDLVAEPPLFENYFHPLEAPGSLVSLGEVKLLRGSICEDPRGHPGLPRRLLPIRSKERFSKLVEGGDLYLPVLLWFGGIQRHFPCRNRSAPPV